MNQTVTVNISGIVFHIEVDAYDKLKSYLNKIRSYFKNSEECEEIMTDIEARIAELFNSRLTQTNQVIRSKEVEEVVEIMGKPEQYVNEEDHVEQDSSFSSKSTYNTAKKLFRDPDDRTIGGVAAGIAAYFGMDTIWLRLFFIVAIFFGFGFLLYIILWIIVPEAKTTSDKLLMRGDPVNIDNIGKTFKEEADRVSDNLKKNGHHYGRKAESAFEAFFGFVGHVFSGLFKVLGKVMGVIFLMLGVFCLVGLLGMIVGSETIYSITSDGIFSMESSDFFNLIFISEDQFHLAIVGVALTIGLPIVMLIYAGVKLLFKVKAHSGFAIGMAVLWIIGIFMCAMVGIRMGSELSQNEDVEIIKRINNGVSDYFVSAETENSPGKGILEDRYSVISLDEDSIYMSDIRLTILKSKTDSMTMNIIKSSNGHSRKNAASNAKMISYKYTVNDDKLFFNNYLSTLKGNKIRGQEVRLKLYLPIGKSIYLDKSLEDIVYNIDNVTNTWDRKMMNKKWVMLEEGLTCLDCQEISGITSLELDSIRTIKRIEEKE